MAPGGRRATKYLRGTNKKVPGFAIEAGHDRKRLKTPGHHENEDEKEGYLRK